MGSIEFLENVSILSSGGLFEATFGLLAEAGAWAEAVAKLIGLVA